MKLALSSRPWEGPEGYSIDQLRHIELARELGYAGVELRYPLLPEGEAETKRVRAALDANGIAAVFGPCAGVPADAAGWDDAARVMDTLKALGAGWVKCIPRNDDDDVPGMAQLGDMARDRGMMLCTQLHANTLTDTVDTTESFLKRVDHPAVGVIFDAAHLQLANDSDIAGAVERLRPWLQLVNIQCLAKDPATGQWAPAPPDAPGATDLVATLAALPADDLWLTVMPACPAGEDPAALARQYHEVVGRALK